MNSIYKKKSIQLGIKIIIFVILYFYYFNKLYYYVPNYISHFIFIDIYYSIFYLSNQHVIQYDNMLVVTLGTTHLLCCQLMFCS